MNKYEYICVHKYEYICVQILEKLPGNGYINGQFDKAMLKTRLEREDYWMKTLRTVYPYGLNDRTKLMNKMKPVG